MHKVRDNYTAEIIVVLVIATMLLTSCASVNAIHEKCMYANQEWEDIN